MPAENLGNPIHGALHNLAGGGQAQFYQRGLVIKTAGGEWEVLFNFPMIGRPHIATSSAALEPGAMSFTNVDVAKLAQEALTGRIGLSPTAGHGAAVVSFGPPAANPDGSTTYVLPSSASLQERQLYDVSILDNFNSWHVVAQNAVYYRSSWHDFGIAHITDMHVAKRIDSFRANLEAKGRPEGAQNLYNWNDRFRGFVRYANYLHSIGELDVIVATGDLIDYIYETEDLEHGTSNAWFLYYLITGQAPGPQFPDVEVLRVPIFMVPGNHDYRLNPYRLIFDIASGLGPLYAAHMRNYSGYNLSKDDGIALSVASGDSLEIPSVSSETARWMVDVDPDPHWRSLIAPKGSYVIRLGDHRIVMIDSSHDLGITEGKYEALKLKFWDMGEDKETFIGGSPNCEGVDGDAIRLATSTLADMPANGLFILGIHAPLFNVWDSAYPYFMRETLRLMGMHERQVEAFLVKHAGLPEHPGLTAQGTSEAMLRQAVREEHPEWFSAAGHQTDVTFVKRGDSQDLLDFGVSRGHADDLLRALAGLDSPRKGDVVLAGHTHRHNEFRIGIDPESGDPAFYMDFYTFNPRFYYPTRFFTSFAVSDVTYVEVTAEAERNATPWPLPHEGKYKLHLKVPRYHNPLSDTTDARTWWAEHRPLILQTGALGPMESAPSFSGFRVLSVKNDVIEKIHFVSISKLEQNNYRLPWAEASAIEPASWHKYVERSRYFNWPAAVGTPATVVTPSNGGTTTVYRDTNGNLVELWTLPGGEVGNGNLTGGAGAPHATADPSVYLPANTGRPVVLYRGSNGHVHGIYYTDGGAGLDRLSEGAQSPKAAEGTVPVGYYNQATDITHVIYRSADGHLHALYWKGSEAVQYENQSLTSMAPDPPPAVGSPSAYLDTTDNYNIVVFRGTDDHIHGLYWSDGPVGHDNLSAAAGAPPAAGDPVGYYIASHPINGTSDVARDVNTVTYRGNDGHIYELWWIGEETVNPNGLTVGIGAPRAASDPVAYYDPGTNTKHVIYLAEDGHLHELWWSPGGSIPQDVDLTVAALAAPAAGKPMAFSMQSPGSQHVVYRGADDQIHEIYWP